MTRLVPIEEVLAQMRKLFRLALLLILLVGSSLWSYRQVEGVIASIQETKTEFVPEGCEDKRRKNGFEEMIKQSGQFQGWSVLILGGIIAVIITTKVHKYPLPLVAWAYVAIGVAAVFLVFSLYAGWVLEKRYTFLLPFNDFADFKNMNALLQLQAKFFMLSMAAVSIFAGWFLVLIILEKVDPTDSGGARV
jgi:hypothetical protein